MPHSQELIRIGMYGCAWDELVGRPFAGVMRAAYEDPRLIVCDCRSSPSETEFSTPPPWRGKLDGVLLSVGLGESETPEQMLKWVDEGGVPVVSLAGDVIDPQLPVVCTDPGSIAGLAAKHLLDRGCRRFLYVGYSLSMGSRLRAQAFREALAPHGFEPDEYEFDRMVEETEEPPPLTGYGMELSPLLTRRPQPVGVLAVGDPFARAVARICESFGINVPSQVAIVGVNDLPVAIAEHPTITSIRYPGEEVGYRGARLLVNLIEGARRPRKPIFIAAKKLIPRQSTTGADDEMTDAIALALRLIQRNACSGLRPYDLVKLVGGSRRWLELEFRKRLGRSPLEEINRVRMIHARRLLDSTDLPIQQIAGMTGFANKSGLTRFFRKHTSLTPRQYRHWSRRGGSP